MYNITNSYKLAHTGLGRIDSLSRPLKSTKKLFLNEQYVYLKRKASKVISQSKKKSQTLN